MKEKCDERERERERGEEDRGRLVLCFAMKWREE